MKQTMQQFILSYINEKINRHPNMLFCSRMFQEELKEIMYKNGVAHNADTISRELRKFKHFLGAQHFKFEEVHLNGKREKFFKVVKK